MTALSLVTAVTVGLVTGLTGRVVAPRSRPAPWWLPVAAGIAAAMLATVVARTTNSAPGGPGLVEIGLQLLLATAAVTAVGVTADRTPAGGRWKRDSRETP
ncbi:GlsB/YeaQ/YmgE family stress response membrane protein [Actinoplanes sp. NPDC051859]|uniref:GlsB/YeaQ/YmgE family stress response membrane protein n=1 Tax=Actinoplanes sp. NPDC051859 TaxID=3363909 RepID=UPI0037AC6DF5